MRIGAPGQPIPERRIGITPDIARRYKADGHEVVVEQGAGARAGFPDRAYRDAGAEIVRSAWEADVVVTVGPPGDEERSRLRPEARLVGLLRPLDDPGSMRVIAATGVTAMAFETLPRTTRAQAMDVLSSQATLAGYGLALEAATHLAKIFPMMMTAAGTIRPATVLVLGCGVAGLQAIATARRLGAVVKGYDVRSSAAEQVRSLGAEFIDLELALQDASTSGGYARRLEVDDQTRLLTSLEPHLAAADAVITAAAIPGRKAPLLVSAAAVKSMRPGSVIVDGAADRGGNCELTESGRAIDAGGVTISGPLGLEGRPAADASRTFARNAYELVTYLVSEPMPDADDEIRAGVTITHQGEVVHPAVLERLSMEGS